MPVRPQAEEPLQPLVVVVAALAAAADEFVIEVGFVFDWQRLVLESWIVVSMLSVV
jgi:hypothetical protein